MQGHRWIYYGKQFVYYVDINTTYQAFVYACGKAQFHQLRRVVIPPKPPSLYMSAVQYIRLARIFSYNHLYSLWSTSYSSFAEWRNDGIDIKTQTTKNMCTDPSFAYCVYIWPSVSRPLSSRLKGTLLQPKLHIHEDVKAKRIKWENVFERRIECEFRCVHVCETCENHISFYSTNIHNIKYYLLWGGYCTKIRKKFSDPRKIASFFYFSKISKLINLMFSNLL